MNSGPFAILIFTKVTALVTGIRFILYVSHVPVSPGPPAAVEPPLKP